jgi:superkiller protein 8
MPFSLSGTHDLSFHNPAKSNRNSGLVKPVRAVAFSPGGRILAAAGDSKVIVLYDTSSGEQIANLSGHGAWVLSLSWSSSGEHLLSR